MKILVIGGGAGGYFAAITAAEKSPGASIVIAEAGSKPLRKVKISGGGRCNVTHSCFEPKELTVAYPRGEKELRGAFSRFQPLDTIDWFKERGVHLKTEEDGRIFPTTDCSSTIIECFETLRKKLNIELMLNSKVRSIAKNDSGGFSVKIKNEKQTKSDNFDRIVLATGSTEFSYSLAKSLGHTIEPLSPSLFTFVVKDPRLEGLSGLSLEQVGLELSVPGAKKFFEEGPQLITHWGLSGPAIIRLSAWAARELQQADYQAKLKLNWLAAKSREEIENAIGLIRNQSPKKIIPSTPAVAIPKRLWAKLVNAADIPDTLNYSALSSKMTDKLIEQLSSAVFKVSGKGVFKEEFVTCGGVSLKEIDFRTMESKLSPGLFFAGEVLNIDGITGGYNFQSAWTTGFIAGSSTGQ